MPMKMGRNLEHTTERLTEGLRCPWKWGQWASCRSKPGSTKPGVTEMKSCPYWGYSTETDFEQYFYV